MALDAVTKLKDEIAAALSENLRQDAFIQDFLEKAKQKDGTLTLEDVQKFSERLGEATSKALLDTVGADVLTDEQLKREVTSRLVRPMLEQNFDNIQAEANRVQKILDESDGIGLNGVSAEFPADRATGLVDKVNESESVEEAQSYLGEPVVNFHMHGYDSWVQANAKFRADAGMESKIIRRGHFGMCAWCAALAGTFEYGGDDMPKDVFRRHQYCKCVVLFTSERGKVRDVHSKIEYGNIRDARVARIRQLEQQRKASPEELEARKTLHREIFKGPVENGLANPGKSAIIKTAESTGDANPSAAKTYDTSQYPHNPNGTIVVSRVVDNKAPNDARPYEVIDVRTSKGTINRTYIDAEGRRGQRIDSTDHGQPKHHPEGAHKHIMIYDENGNYRGDGPWISLTDKDKLENADLPLQMSTREDTAL